MASQKLVRCEVRRGESQSEPQLRYVPLEIFGLWEYLMHRRHGFEVGIPEASLWLDAEETPESAYDEREYDRVTEVSVFLYSGRDDMFTRVCRYFPTEHCQALKQIFLAHYPADDAGIQTRLRERPGFWIHRHEASAARP
jgi:hypothetical protein